MIFPVTIKPYCQLKEESSQYIYRGNQRWHGEPENGPGRCDPLLQRATIARAYLSKKIIEKKISDTSTCALPLKKTKKKKIISGECTELYQSYISLTLEVDSLSES